MNLTEKLKKLITDNMLDCEAHEDCSTCLLNKYVKVTMPVGDLESLTSDGDSSGNMPFGKIEFQVQPCMMFSEIIRQLPMKANLNSKEEKQEPGPLPIGLVIILDAPGFAHSGTRTLVYEY